MYYLIISLSALIFAIQFMFNDGYQKESGNGWNSSLKLSLYSSLVGLVALLAINGFKLRISLFSVVVALVYSAVCVMLNFFTVRALKYANLSVYSVFSMIGGMMLPFIYGLFCGEEFKAIRILCCILITVSIAISVDKGNDSKKAFKYYIAVFVLNGMVGVISKFHQSYPEYCVDSADFLIISKIVTALISVILITVSKEKNFAVSVKALGYSAGGAVLNSVANLMLLIALLKLPASVQYPIVTGGVIVFSTVIDVIRKNKLKNREIIAAVVAFAATAVMAV